MRIKDNFTHTVREMEGFYDFIAEAIFREMIWGQFSLNTRYWGTDGPIWRLSKKRVQSARGLWCIFPQ